LDNHLLLYHGSKPFNYLGILSQGLRIAPPEAPPTGYMFGKGVYFADVFEKSLGYCYDYNNNGEQSQIMLMCEVACGKSYEAIQSEYIEKLKPGFHSCKGVGINQPNYNNMITLPNGVQLPFGKMEQYEIGTSGNI
jgi:hypothetical protein